MLSDRRTWLSDIERNNYIDQAKQHISFTEQDMNKARALQSEIKTSENYEKCKIIIGNELLDFEFKTIEEIFNENYEISY